MSDRIPGANGDGGRLAGAPTIEELRDRPEAGRPGALGFPLLPLLLRALQVAELCSVSLSTWERWDAAGKVPRGRKPSRGVKLWSRAELEKWVALGCPDRRTFEACKGGSRK
jgi:hypothetical protein